MKTVPEAQAAAYEREKDLWSAINDYKDGDCDHRRVQHFLDLYTSATEVAAIVAERAETDLQRERVAQHKSALRVAIAYASGDLIVATPEADQEVAGCRIVLEEG